MDENTIKLPPDLRGYEVLVIECNRQSGMLTLRLGPDESYRLGHQTLQRSKISQYLEAALKLSHGVVTDEWISQSTVYGNAVLHTRKGMKISSIRREPEPLIHGAFREVETRMGIHQSAPYVDPIATRPESSEPSRHTKFRPTRNVTP